METLKKKARTAHVPKFDVNDLKEAKKRKDRSSVTPEPKIPKIVACGIVDQKPVVFAAPVKTEPVDRDEVIFLKGLRPRKPDRIYDEAEFNLRLTKSLLEQRRERRGRPAKKQKEPEISATIEDVLKLMKKDNPTPDTPLRPCKNFCDWDRYIQNPKNLEKIPPVDFFKNAPLSSIWKEIAKVGLAIELRNPFVKGPVDVFWVGTIIAFAGYKALVKFESFEKPSSKHLKPRLSWISFCSNVPRHLGWCKKNGFLLDPGPVVRKSIGKEKLQGLLEEFMKKPTIAEDHDQRLRRAVQEERRFTGRGVNEIHNLPIEVMDKDDLQFHRLGRVSTVLGNRLHVAYYEDRPIDKADNPADGKRGHWYHINEGCIHPLGWSHTVGTVLKGIREDANLPVLPPEVFPHYPANLVNIQKGMLFETRHPLQTYKLVGAEIIEILKYGYFMAETRESNRWDRQKLIYHITSSFILPLGFGASHDVKVDFHPPPESDTEDQLKIDLLPPKSENKFKVGQKLESVDIFRGTRSGPATIVKVAGHLLFIHNDGWKKEILNNYQWVDTEVSDIYPCGYREMLGIKWLSYVDES